MIKARLFEAGLHPLWCRSIWTFGWQGQILLEKCLKNCRNGGEVCFCLGRSVGDNPFLLGHFWDRFTSSLKEATNRKGSMSHGIEVGPCLGRQRLKAAGCMTGMGLLRLFLHWHRKSEFPRNVQKLPSGSNSLLKTKSCIQIKTSMNLHKVHQAPRGEHMALTWRCTS